MSTYAEYFQLAVFHPEINQQTFRDSPDGWKHTYPHKTFVELLKRTAKMLAPASAHGNAPHLISEQCEIAHLLFNFFEVQPHT
ncbi:MAG: hypothetical protein K5651_01820 [Bacteroidales bacterium]|nr:hypothetical protein [Bacteroidales bacterium]